MLHNSSDEKLLSQVQKIIKNTSLTTEYSKFSFRINEIEDRQHELKKELQGLKHNFAKKLINGLT